MRYRCLSAPARECIASLLNGFVLDVAGGNAAAGTRVIAWPRQTPPANNQRWVLQQTID